LFPHSLNIGKSIEPEGTKVGEGEGDEEESINAFDVSRFTSLYEYHNRIPPTQEELARFKGVEENLFYLVNFILENDQSLLDGDFITQVMNQYDGLPEDMMDYVEEYVENAKRAKMLAIDPPPPDESSSSATPHLQIAGGPVVIENGVEDMDTTRDAKRRREQVITRQTSRANVLALEN
jgi:hypothetical protein